MQPEITISWVGHATVLLAVDGFRIITDPILTSRVVHLRRRVAVPTIEPVDVVLISHLHMDHLHLRSLKTVTQGARVVAPAGAAKLFRSLDLASLEEVVAGDAVTLRAPTGDAPAIPPSLSAPPIGGAAGRAAPAMPSRCEHQPGTPPRSRLSSCPPTPPTH